MDVRASSAGYFVAAALLAVFGTLSIAEAHTSTGFDSAVNGGVQLGLAALMLVAAVLLRRGPASARMFAVVAGAVTVGVGTFAVLGGHGYMAGSIVAAIATVQLVMSPETASPTVLRTRRFERREREPEPAPVVRRRPNVTYSAAPEPPPPWTDPLKYRRFSADEPAEADGPDAPDQDPNRS